MLACMVLAGCSLERRSAAPEASTAETASDQATEARADLPAAGPELLNPMIAKVEATGGGGPGDFGSAVIIGRASGDIRLITAKHVVTSGRDLQTRQLRAYEQIEVEFWFDRGTQHVARLEPMADSALDLAVLVVPETAALAQRLEDLPFDFESLLRRVRSPAALQLHDGLFTIGHPNGIPWYSAPFELDRVLTVDEDEIEFRSGFINTGHSGGALFSQDWYLVGMITHDRLPGGRALRIDRIVEQLEAWDQHVALAVPALPPTPGAPLRDWPDCPELVQLPPGTFIMGAEENAIDPSGTRPRATRSPSPPLSWSAGTRSPTRNFRRSSRPPATKPPMAARSGPRTNALGSGMATRAGAILAIRSRTTAARSSASSGPTPRLMWTG